MTAGTVTVGMCYAHVDVPHHLGNGCEELGKSWEQIGASRQAKDMKVRFDEGLRPDLRFAANQVTAAFFANRNLIRRVSDRCLRQT